MKRGQKGKRKINFHFKCFQVAFYHTFTHINETFTILISLHFEDDVAEKISFRECSHERAEKENLI